MSDSVSFMAGPGGGKLVPSNSGSVPANAIVRDLGSAIGRAATRGAVRALSNYINSGSKPPSNTMLRATANDDADSNNGKQVPTKPSNRRGGGKNKGAYRGRRNMKTPKGGYPTNSNGNGNGGGQIPNPGVVGSQQTGVETVSWSSDVISGLIYDPQRSTSKHTSPLYIIQGQFVPPFSESKNSYYKQIVDNYIYPFYLDAMYSVNQRSANYVTESDFTDYFDCVTECLQLYYMVDSILAYCSSNDNQNVGMRHLRNKLSPEILAQHQFLMERLTTFAIPETMVQYLRYMYQNFTFGDMVGAPILRMGYRALLGDHNVESEKLSVETYSELFIRMQNISNIKAFLNRAFYQNPRYIRSAMPPSASTVMQDNQFCTFWHNCNIAYFANEICYSRNVSSLDENIYYGAIAENVDGAIYAASSITHIIQTEQTNKTNDGEEMFVMKISGQHTGIWAPYDKMNKDWDILHRSCLLTYRRGRMLSCGPQTLRIQSGVFSAPYQMNDNTQWTNLAVSLPSVRLAEVHSINYLAQAVSQTAKILYEI